MDVVNLSPRQELVLRNVVRAYQATGMPVGSKVLAADPGLDCGSSTIRNELAMLEEHGLLAHPHTSAGRVPTDAGHRYYVEVRHKAGVGTDHVSVGWLKPGEGLPDPSTVNTASEVVPTYALSPRSCAKRSR